MGNLEKIKYVQRDLEDLIEEEYISRGEVYNRTQIKQTMQPITTSGVLADLKNGFTRLKKDDVGFGSIQEKYGLSVDEVKELFQTPSLKAKKTAIPKRKLEIIDDLSQPQGEVPEAWVALVSPFDPSAQTIGITAQEAGKAYDNLIATGIALPEALAVLPDVPQGEKNAEGPAPESKAQDTKDSIFA